MTARPGQPGVKIKESPGTIQWQDESDMYPIQENNRATISATQ